MAPVTARIVWLGEHPAPEEPSEARWRSLEARCSEIERCDMAVMYLPVGKYASELALSELAFATKLGKPTLHAAEDNPNPSNADFWLFRASDHCIPYMSREETVAVAGALVEHACGARFNLPFPRELLSVLRKAESPIEVRLGMHLVQACSLQQIVEPQVEVTTGGKSYRADFLVHSGAEYGNVRAVVEADGHDYHERTKEQAARDKKRDRLMIADGLYVLRFTGSEIWKDPISCAKEVYNFVANKAEEETIRLWEATHK